MSKTPAIFANLHGKVAPELENALSLLFRGMRDHDDAIKTLAGKHDTLSTQVSAVSKTATEASTSAAKANTALAQPVPAGQARAVTADDSLQQSDHLGLVALQGTTALAVGLNNLVQAPYKAKVTNQSTQVATFTPTTGTVNGAGSVTLAAGATKDFYFDGYNWLAA